MLLTPPKPGVPAQPSTSRLTALQPQPRTTPTRVLQTARIPQQLAFQFHR